MAVDTSLIKPVVDAILDLLQWNSDVRLKKDAEKKIREAIRDLLNANPNENKAEAALLAAKAAKLLSPDVILAEQMLHKIKSAKTRETKQKRRRAKTTSKRKAVHKSS